MNYDNEVNEMAASHKGSKITLAQIVLRRVRDIVRGDQSEARKLINLFCVTKQNSMCQAYMCIATPVNKQEAPPLNKPHPYIHTRRQ